MLTKLGYIAVLVSCLLNVIGMILGIFVDYHLLSIYVPIIILSVSILISIPIWCMYLINWDIKMFLYLAPIAIVLLINPSTIDSLIVFAIWRVIIALAYVFVFIGLQFNKD